MSRFGSSVQDTALDIGTLLAVFLSLRAILRSSSTILFRRAPSPDGRSAACWYRTGCAGIALQGAEGDVLPGRTAPGGFQLDLGRHPEVLDRPATVRRRTHEQVNLPRALSGWFGSAVALVPGRVAFRYHEYGRGAHWDLDRRVATRCSFCFRAD